MNDSYFFNGPLARRIGVYVILASACVTLFTSGIQLYSEYKRDIDSIHIRLDQLERTQISNIASRVWVMDLRELERTLDALLHLPSIEYVAVYDYDKLLLSMGTNFDKNIIEEKHRLTYEHNGEIQDIGSIVIKASLDEVYSLIIDRAVVILLSNGLKTFVVAGFILFIFYCLVSRHLAKISNNVQNEDFLSVKSKLILDRKKTTDNDDELDVVVNSINNMRTKLRNQFQEINSQKHYLSLTLNSIGDAVITTDPQGNITRMNEVAQNLTGWRVKEAVLHPVRSVFQVTDSEKLEPVFNLLDGITSKEKLLNLKNNTILHSRDGIEYSISYNVAPIRDDKERLLGIVLIFHDITEQFALREGIAKSKRDMQAIMDNSPAVIYIKDIKGRYQFINKRYETLFKLNREKIVGKTDHEIHDLYSADTFRRNDDNVKRAGHPLELEETVTHPDGEVHTYMSIKFPLLEESGNIYAICGISTDITERKIQENHLRRAQKMDALGKLTSGIAHDYNNMLGIILGYAQLLESSLSDNPTLQKYASEIHHAGDRGSKLTKKLLDFSSQDSTDASSMNINTVLRDEKHMLEKTLTPKIHLKMDLDNDLWNTYLDSSELEDAVINICINAMHAIEDRGEISVKTSNKLVEQREADRLGIRKGEYVVLSISDTGCGMDESTKERIFDPFYSTKGTNGTGLGLSQVYGFVERSSGAIDVFSTIGKGTRIELYFPRGHGVSKISSLTEFSENKESYYGNETVLIVDDEPSLIGMMSENLSMFGYRVLTASNGEEALEIIMNEPVDLVVSDIIMPKIDGPQLVSKIKNQYPHIKMQMVSGYTDNRINSILDNELAKNILYKPFTTEDLLGSIRNLLEDSKDENKLAGCTVLVMDDMDDMRELFRIHLNKLGCNVICVKNGVEAISMYKKCMAKGNKIDIVILDLSIPGGAGGEEIAEELRSIDPDVKLILASGYTQTPEGTMENYTDNAGILEKNFDQTKLKQMLESVLVN